MKFSNPTLIVAPKIRDTFFGFLCSASSTLYTLLKRINEEKLKENQEQSKRRLSTSDDEQILVFKNRDSLISSTTTKKTKINDYCDYSSDDTENILDDSAVPDEILFDL